MENKEQFAMSDIENYAFSIKEESYEDKEGTTKTRYKIYYYGSKGRKEYVDEDGFKRVGYKGKNGNIHFYKVFVHENGSIDKL